MKLFVFSIDRGISRRVCHRRPWLSDMSQLGVLPCRFLARPGCSTRRCVGPRRVLRTSIGGYASKPRDQCGDV